MNVLCLRINLIQSLVFYDELLLRYAHFCRYIPFFKIAQWVGVAMETMQYFTQTNGLIFEEHNLLHLSGLIEPFGINKKCSKGFNVVLITPWVLGYPMVLPSFFKFSLIFMNMQMR